MSGLAGLSSFTMGVSELRTLVHGRINNVQKKRDFPNNFLL